jgi:hypothetical protein
VIVAATAIFPSTFFGSAGSGQQSFATARSAPSRQVPEPSSRKLVHL